MSEALNVATRKRAAIKSQLTRFHTYLDNFSEQPDFAQLKERLIKVKESWHSFDIVQTEIENEKKEVQDEERDAFEKNYFALLSRAQQYIDTNGSPANTLPQGSALTSMSFPALEHVVRLPPIDLPKFSGRYDQWSPFYDGFKSMVHDNANVQPVQKFYYLRSALEGDAAELIESLETSPENYKNAWELLIQRYENRRVIVKSHIRALFELPSMSKESASQVQQLIDNASKHLRALKALGERTEYWDSLIVQLISIKLDNLTYKDWERSIDDTVVPSLDSFWKFLRQRCHSIDDTSSNNTFGRSNQTQRTVSSNKSRQVCVATKKDFSCPICKRQHKIRECQTFANYEHTEKISAVKSNGLCFNCLNPFHTVDKCKSNFTCQKCSKKHNTLLHPPANDAPKAVPENVNNSKRAVTSLQACSVSHVLLSTASVKVLDSSGRAVDCKILLDSGSQSNFITERLADALELAKRDVSVPVAGFNQALTHIKHAVNATILSRNKRFSAPLNFLVVPQISERLPTEYIDRKELNIPKNISLADPEFNIPSEIDALVGAEMFYHLLCIGQIRINKERLVLQKTRLGWLVAGEVSGGIYSMSDVKSVNASQTTLKITLDSLNVQIAKFWELEEIPSTKHMSDDEKICEELFVKTTSRDDSGRYCVRLPFNDKKYKIGDSRAIAEKRFYSNERRYLEDEQTREQYAKFMQEYLTLGHMTELENKDEALAKYFIPHHPVMKSDSLTTKLRVVFDASSKTTTNVSLNDALLVGPNIQDDIFSIVTRFRSHAFVFAADIEKMYRQVKLHPEDTRYQLILWRQNRDEPLKTYKLNTLTYGTAPASFLATRCLHQLGLDETDSFPLAAKAIRRDFYVDDLLSGADTFQEAVQLRDELIAILHRGGFNIRQWCSNEPKLIEPLVLTSSDPHICLNASETHKTLGIHWNAQDDVITYSVNLPEDNAPVTKRTMLSQIASLFDPLGLLGPVIVIAKILMRELWQQKIEWDESIPMDINTAWSNFKNQLPKLNEFVIPRCIMKKPLHELQLHGFCDSSEKAFGACIYLRSTNADLHTVCLVCSKSRVAPMKKISLPRLELCAAALLTRLYEAVSRALNTKFDKVFFWSDSTITLHWIRASPHKLKTFVANRIARIQSSTKPISWRHVPSKDNVADELSRGQLPEDYVSNARWMCGPDWLSKDEGSWPENILPVTEMPELRNVVSLKITTTVDIVNRFSSLTRLKRVLGYCLRFVYNTTHVEKRSGPLTPDELRQSIVCIIKLVQDIAFASEKRQIIKTECVKHSLTALNPFIDTDGILRVGGRLKHAELGFNQKHPILLPKNNHLSELIIKDAHFRTHHGGVQLTLYTIRHDYWVVDARRYIKKIIRSCIICFRLKPSTPEYIMGNLPEDRLVAARAFENVGLDYCGPFFIKEKAFRNRNKIKAYVAVFVCLVTKAIHLELVSNLTTEAFLAALRRFFARRGKAKIIRSDNATNFRGACNELKELGELWQSDKHSKQVERFCADQGITWKFIPPRAPHFGGIWEAAVKGFKHHMRRVVGEKLLSFEEFNTFIIETEAILNSRPLTALSSDPNDMLPLTPAHFLIGGPLIALNSLDVSCIDSNRLSNWQYVQKLREHFWKRWYKEYINELQLRSKWTSCDKDIFKIGRMVLMKEDNVAPQHWKLGRVLEVHSGDDNIIRVVTVKTPTGVYKRSVKKLAILPVD